jgi:4,5-DOPA dioxygenase extradiol
MIESRVAEGNGRMPVMFVGHGSPMNVIEDNRWSRGFAALARFAPSPQAVLCISAHWYVDGTFLTSDGRPNMIHDFSGFPEALNEIDYPAPGDPVLAERICGLLENQRAELRGDWGLDHGAWSVLRRMYPDARVPVIQLSIDRRLEPGAHFEIGKSLAGLRDEGVLILGSGNVTHNLDDAFRQMRAGSAETPEWALRFDLAVTSMLEERDTEGLVSIWPDSPDASRAHPTPDHWLPLLYAYGASNDFDRIRFAQLGFDWGSLSMRSVVFG